MSTTRESVGAIAKSLGWKYSDLITLCNHLQLPPKEQRTTADLEKVAAALTGPPAAVLDRLITPFRPGERVVFTGQYPEWAVGRILTVELSWPQRTWVLNPDSGKQDNSRNLRTEELKRYEQGGQE
jgi:hypothetical protein